MKTITEHIVCDRCNDVITTDPSDEEEGEYGRYFTVGTRTDPADRSEMQITRAVHLCPEHWVAFGEALYGRNWDWMIARDRVLLIESPNEQAPFDAVEYRTRKQIINSFLQNGSVPESSRYSWE